MLAQVDSVIFLPGVGKKTLPEAPGLTQNGVSSKMELVGLYTNILVKSVLSDQVPSGLWS